MTAPVLNRDDLLLEAAALAATLLTYEERRSAVLEFEPDRCSVHSKASG